VTVPEAGAAPSFSRQCVVAGNSCRQSGRNTVALSASSGSTSSEYRRGRPDRNCASSSGIAATRSLYRLARYAADESAGTSAQSAKVRVRTRRTRSNSGHSFSITHRSVANASGEAKNGGSLTWCARTGLEPERALLGLDPSLDSRSGARAPLPGPTIQATAAFFAAAHVLPSRPIPPECERRQ
jgi:hypothetical protein